MMSEHYVECRALPTINETFPQFCTRPTGQEANYPQLSSSPITTAATATATTTATAPAKGISKNNLILSPLDLSLRAGVNIAPITPPSTPSPPRKRTRFMSDEHYLWRPHVMGTPTATTSNTTTTVNTAADEQRHQSFLHTMTYTRREQINSAYALNEEEAYTHIDRTATATVKAPQSFNSDNDNNNRETINNNFAEIPKIQRSESTLAINDYQRTPPQHVKAHATQVQHHKNMSATTTTIYVDDETIVLTEDEDDDDEVDADAADNEEDEDDDDNEFDEENETLVSSQELNEDDETNEPLLTHHSLRSPHNISTNSYNSQFNQQHSNPEENVDNDDDDEEEYVDVLGNDDDEDINPLSGRAITMLRLQSQADLEQELEKTGKVLTRNKLIYENEELHNRAVDGLAKLFDRDFQRRQDETSSSSVSVDNLDNDKTYIDLTNCHKSKAAITFTMPTPIQQQQQQQQQQHQQQQHQQHTPDKGQQQFMISSQLSSTTSTTSRPYKTHKTERKRMKLRKHMALDEETISPVSGTIIRKLRDDEELVVRKGDIDPAFNVVEVTEEAKAILASIDNKIGAYLCQLCRTLYDDAFKLAQHRCPRIVHIEYKCSECEKVFNCPANLASHRRWHKPKSELLANSQSKKRQHSERNPQTSGNLPEKLAIDDGVDGIYPCNQCGKTFRRNAYLKKHQASHQMLENLKSLDIFKNSSATANVATFQPTTAHGGQHGHQSAAPRMQSNPLYPALQHPRPYPARFGGFPFPSPFDHRRFYTLGEFYLSQQLERSSAFQYVQQANHLRNLSNVAGNFINRPVVPSPIIPLPVK